MARIFTFVGNGKDDPDSLLIFGRTFIRGEPLAVDDSETYIIGKLRGNSHFTESVQAPPQQSAQSAPTPEAPKKRGRGRPRKNPVPE